MSRRAEVSYLPGADIVIRDLVVGQLVRIPRHELVLVLGELRQTAWTIEDEEAAHA